MWYVFGTMLAHNGTRYETQREYCHTAEEAKSLCDSRNRNDKEATAASYSYLDDGSGELVFEQFYWTEEKDNEERI